MSPGDLMQKITDICSATDAQPDGLKFDLSQLRVEEIREGNTYGGLRARFSASLDGALIPIQIDFGIGDAVTPAPIAADYPTLLDLPAPNILSYPRETAIAEKLEAIVQLGLDNSRMKDYFDLFFFAETFPYSPDMPLAVKRTFERRQQELPEEVPVGLSGEFALNADKSRQWKAFQSRLTSASIDLVIVVSKIRDFAMPLFESARALDE